MIDLSLLTDGGVGWLDASGPSSHLVLSTRIRLARNLAGRVFQGRNSETEREDILQTVESAARDTVLLRRAIKFRLDLLERTDRQLLHERHLVSKELAGLDADGRVRSGASVLVQDRLGAELGQRLAFAFHSEFGYLTSCPTNVGTGLRASVLIHLPGLVLTKEITKVLQGLAQVGLTFRGLYGEGSEVVGNFFQLSNQTTLGKSEEELLDHLGRIVRQVIEYEVQARDVLVRDAPTIIADKVWRAYGLLRYARSLTFEETMNLLSGVRLGVGLNLISGLSVYTLNKLLIFTQPAHLAALEGRPPGDPELPAVRATYVRKLLDAEAGLNNDERVQIYRSGAEGSSKGAGRR